jgi:hypothetical protein
MIEKHFLFIDDNTTVGMRYDFEDSVLVFGGLFRFRKILVDIIERLLPERDYDMVKIFRNKVRLVVSVSHKEYNEFLKLLPDQGIVIQQTPTLQRIMR